MSFEIDLIPFTKKAAALAELSEDDFRDKIVRPLFLKKGFSHGQEMCGADEEGKDCYFTTVDPLGQEMIYAIQTKAGNITMAADPQKNVETVISQMKTLMGTTIADPKTKTKRRPNIGILCASGKINTAARKHICDEVREPNIRFIDVNDLVSDIDQHFPEYWQGISAERNPYLSSLHEELVNAKDVLSLSNIMAELELTPTVSEEGFANLRLSRTSLRRKKAHGVVKQEPFFEEIASVKLFERKRRQFLIKGDPGFGKSTLLRRLAESLIQRTLAGHGSEIPVLLRAIEVAESEISVAELSIIATKKINKKSGEGAFTVQDLLDGNVTVFIDAIDEISTDEGKEELVRKLSIFTEDYANCRIVITSRFISFITKSAFFSTFEEWNILPLAWRDAKFMLDRAAKNKLMPESRKGEVLRQLEQIHGIDINPLLVTVMVASTDSSRKDIPANITELFSKFCEMMLGRWDSKKGFSQQFDAPLKHRILSQIALEMHKKRTVSLPKVDFIDLLRERLERLTKSSEKIEILIDEILFRSGLLREVEGNIEFRHLLLQEYFAGSAIAKSAEILPFLGDEWWRRVVIFYFGSNPNDGDGLLSIAVDSEYRNSSEAFCGAVTIGLAAQACYFVDIPDRVDIFRSVAETFSTHADLYLSSDSKYPIHDFLHHYLTGRDSLASDLIENLTFTSADSDIERTELNKFWILVGLIESGNLEKALKCIERYRIKNPRLLMAIHMGAFMHAHGRVSTKESKDFAKRICDKLDLHVASQRTEFLREFKSLMLEIRGGRIVEVDEPVLE